MVLYEYNEAETMKMFRQEGFDEGFDLRLINQICRKIKKNLDIKRIANDLEEEIPAIQRIYDTALLFSPEFDEKKIYQALCEKDGKHDADSV